MLQGAPQFTPRQLLDAGRRSEAEGKTDFAVQFYLHIAEHYGTTPEAVEARTALARMAGTSRQQVWDADAPGIDARPHAGSTLEPAAARDRYRSGRLLAALFSGIGWITINASLLGLAVYAGARYFQIAILQPFDLGTDLLVRLPFATLGGAALVIFGQVARALLEQANITRRLLALERARAGLDQR